MTDKKVEVVEKDDKDVKDVVDDVVVCGVCGEGFLDDPALKVHMAQMHTELEHDEEAALKAAVTKGSVEKKPVDLPGDVAPVEEKVAFEDLPGDAVLTVPVPLLKRELLAIRKVKGFIDEAEYIRDAVRDKLDG